MVSHYHGYKCVVYYLAKSKRALGIVDAEPEVKAKSAKMAMLTSRTNTLLSVPMLYLMVAQQNVGLG